jgi:hypothetical protein
MLNCAILYYRNFAPHNSNLCYTMGQISHFVPEELALIYDMNSTVNEKDDRVNITLIN